MIALYCGARTNGATTLRYTDIVDQGGIKCFDFKLDDDSDVEDPDYDPYIKYKLRQQDSMEYLIQIVS